jgi:hypothetical protein
MCHRHICVIFMAHVQSMRRQLRFFTTFFLCFFLILLIIVNWRIYDTPEVVKVEHDSVNYDVLCQLRYLRYAIEELDAANSMQQDYPEGDLFFNVIYGLSWCDLAEPLDKNSILYAEAHVEIQRAFNHVNSEQGRVIFDPALPLAYGAFYNGWSGYLLGKKLSIENPDKRDAHELKLFKERCENIAAAIMRQTWPETYYGSAWPADVVVCVATLALHDQMFPAIYQPHIANWVSRVKLLTDKHGQIPHQVHHASEMAITESRGSSLSLMLCFLPDIDAPFANEQFRLYEDSFHDRMLGLHGIRELRKGSDAVEDIDSGPVIFGFGGAATITGMRALKFYGQYAKAKAISNTIEALGFSYKAGGRKKYFMGKLPMADVFIAWAQGPFRPAHTRSDEYENHRLTFNLWSCAVALVILFILIWMWREQLVKLRGKIRRRIFRKKAR